MPDFRKKLNSNRILIADGATGTMLQKAGLPIGVAPERWNLENPDAVLNHYLAYIEAGSDIILTNTFGGSYIRLKRDNLQDNCQNINKRAAELARQAAGSSVIVFGDLGPTGELISPLGLLSENEVVESFAIQVNGLVQGGVDAILIETMSDIIEAKAALKAVKDVTDLPVIISFSFDTRGRTMMGVKPDQAAEEIWPLGVTAIGANCGRTLSENLKAIQEIRMAVPEAVLFAKPNAGLPHMDGSELIYDVTPNILAEFASKFIDAGVKIFGGCCGSTPEHIKAIKSTIQSL